MNSKILQYKQLFNEARIKPHNIPKERQVVTALKMAKIAEIKDNKKVAQEMTKLYAYCVISLLYDANYEQSLIAYKLMIKMVRYANTKEG